MVVCTQNVHILVAKIVDGMNYMFYARMVHLQSSLPTPFIGLVAVKVAHR